MDVGLIDGTIVGYVGLDEGIVVIDVGTLDGDIEGEKDVCVGVSDG